MQTLIGYIPDEQLIKKEIVEEVPVGTCTTTQFYFEDKLVRQDIAISVDPAKLYAESGEK